MAPVADPHEIANVLGLAGVRFMLENARRSPFNAYFGAPSCVPATPFETANGDLGCDEIARLLEEPEVCCLSEMMNFPGVLNRDPEVMNKIALAARLGYPVDGHAPGLTGDAAACYAAAGISTDHECTNMQEARDKIAAGMWIRLREGSAARNFDTLHPLISEAPGRVMLCSDDKHPDDLLRGHINGLAARAVARGHSLFDVLLPRVPVQPVNAFRARRIAPADLTVESAGQPIRVIGVTDGSLVTEARTATPRRAGNRVVADIERDILPACVVNRYRPSNPALGYLQGFGLKRGAIASSVAHDSHNIIAVGADPELICRAVNAIIEHKGGIAVAQADRAEILPLPIAGIMSDREGDWVGLEYARLDQRARDLGSSLSAPFMTLSFMALLVIPALKLSDLGLFDGRRFEFVELVDRAV